MELLKKTYSIIPKQQKFKVLIILVLILVQVLLEMIGLGLVIPLVSIILDINLFYETLSFIDIKKFNINEKTLIFIVLGTFLLIYYLKNLYLIFFSWIRNKFASNIWANVCSKLITAYLSKPYLYHVNVNTAEIIRNMEDAKNFETFLNNLVFLIVETLIIIFIFGIFLFLNPKVTLIVLTIMLLFSSIFIFSVKKKLKSWGEQRAHFRRQSTKYLIEAVMGIKQSTVNNVINFFKNRYVKSNKYHAFIHFKYAFIESLPKFLIELVSITTILFLVLILFNLDVQTKKIVLIISFLSACAIRLMPSAIKIINSLNLINFLRPVINNLHNVLNDKSYTKDIQVDNLQKNIPVINFEREIKIQKLDFEFKKNKPIFKNLNLTIKKGSFIGFVGESGSGKSTLINILLGLLKPKNGRITVDDSDINLNISGWRNSIGYVPQDIYITDDNLKNNVAFGINEEQIDNDKVKTALDRSQLKNFYINSPEGLNLNLGENAAKVSGGQKQRIGIARALYRDPKILILDEATSNLDKSTSDDFMEFILSIKREFTILCITHKFDNLSNCDEIYKIENKILNKIN